MHIFIRICCVFCACTATRCAMPGRHRQPRSTRTRQRWGHRGLVDKGIARRQPCAQLCRAPQEEALAAHNDPSNPLKTVFRSKFGLQTVPRHGTWLIRKLMKRRIFCQKIRQGAAPTGKPTYVRPFMFVGDYGCRFAGRRPRHGDHAPASSSI